MTGSRPLVAQLVARTQAGPDKERNEDSIGVAGHTRVVSTGGTLAVEGEIQRGLLCVVADGAGGHPAADQASRLVVSHLLAKAVDLHSSKGLEDAIVNADRELHRVMGTRSDWRGMGSTVAVLVLSPEGVLTANVGDSVIFEADRQGLVLLSVADNPARPAWAPRGPATQLTQMLGGPDVSASVRPHLARYPLEPGMRFLLCSDGLREDLTESEIDSIVTTSTGPATDLVDALVEHAVRNGARDDISVIVVTVGGNSGDSE